MNVAMNLELPPAIQERQKRAASASTALDAAIAIAQMDPHSREDLICYLKALGEAQAAGDMEECEYLIEAIAEVFLVLENDGAPDLDAWIDQAGQHAEGRRAQRALEKESKQFFARYQQLKSHAGLKTIRQVAQACGLSPTTVQAIELQRVKPQAGTLQKLAKGLGVTLEELLGNASKPQRRRSR
jgi:DNA-binding XRE family transcriptional regulator